MKTATSPVSLVQENESRFVGCDDGHFGVKLVTEDADGKLTQTYVPSCVASGAQVIALGDGEENFYEATDGQVYTVSQTLPHIDTRFADYGLSDINRVLVHHALIKAGLAGLNVKLVTGLPVDDFYVANKPNQEFIERKVKSLTEHTVKNKNDAIACAKVVKHVVQPEAIAAFYDLLINDDGTANKDIEAMIATSSVGIIDIGGKTTDSAVIISGGKAIDPARSGTTPIGGLSLNAAVEQRLKAAFKLSQLSAVQIDKAVMTGVLRVFGKDNDCTAIIDEEKRVLADQIIVATKRKMRDAADLEKVYFVGGGSLLLRTQLRDLFPHAEFVEDPQFSNARGMFKIAKYLLGR